MQKKQQQQLPNSQNIMATILASIPKEANVTKKITSVHDLHFTQKLQNS